jgi:hypothetical protein
MRIEKKEGEREVEEEEVLFFRGLMWLQGRRQHNSF